MNRKNFLKTTLASAFALSGLNSFSFSLRRSYNDKLPKLTLDEVVLDKNAELVKITSGPFFGFDGIRRMQNAASGVPAFLGQIKL